MSNFWQRTRLQWSTARPALAIAILLLAAYVFFFWRLDSLTVGLGPQEYYSRQDSQSLQNIATQGVNAPYNLLQYGFSQFLTNEILALRLTSVLFGLVILACLFGLLRNWFGWLIAVFAGLVFATTPWLVLTARSATPDISMLWTIVIFATFYWLLRAKKWYGLWWLLFCLAVVVGAYIPGLIWLLLAAGYIARRSLLNASQQVNGFIVVIGLAAAILLLAPLILAVAVDASRLKQLLLIPADFSSGQETIKFIGSSAAAFFWQTGTAIEMTIDKMPILNFLQIALVAFGIYALSSRARNVTYSLIGLLLFSILAAGINSNLHLLSLGLPAIVIFMAAGLRYLYIEWRHVFPFNPFAYALAIVLISLVVTVHLVYAARYSLAAWPKTDEIRSTYVLE